MIVCICHRISDRDIVAAVRGGETCFEALQDETDIASSCGCCHDCARDVFDQACAQMGQAVAKVSTVHVIRHAASVSSSG